MYNSEMITELETSIDIFSFNTDNNLHLEIFNQIMLSQDSIALSDLEETFNDLTNNEIEI